MFKLHSIAFAACAWAAIAIPSAQAADLGYEPVPVAPETFGGWYLRGDIGYSNQQVEDLDNELFDTADDFEIRFAEFDGGLTFGGGVGYRFSKWFRADVTGEYRSKTDFSGYDTYEFDGGQFPNNYDAKKSEILALANGYVDLGSWRGISPFIGAGVGMVNVEISGFSDTGIGVEGFPSSAYADDHDEWNFAWAVYAGVGFDVTDQLTLELAYRYLDLGDAESGDLVASDGTDEFDNPLEFIDITSHDVRLGVRYAIN